MGCLSWWERGGGWSFYYRVRRFGGSSDDSCGEGFLFENRGVWEKGYCVFKGVMVMYGCYGVRIRWWDGSLLFWDGVGDGGSGGRWERDSDWSGCYGDRNYWCWLR